MDGTGMVSLNAETEDSVFAGVCLGDTDNRAIRILAGVAIGYAMMVVLFVALSGQHVLELMVLLASSLPSALLDFFAIGGVVSVGLLALALMLPHPWRSRMRARLPEAVVALILSNLLFFAFTGMKLTLPHVIPFHADGWLARVDAALHFGFDPWRLTHAVLGTLNITALARLYFDLWLLPAMYLPVLMALFESDPRRKAGFTWLWVSCWLVLGTLLAGAFMSGGPVYHDLLVAPGEERFADLTARFMMSDAVLLKFMQERLWEAYQAHDALVGSGISAFPSVHVGVATVLALYLWELLPGRRLLGLRLNRLVPVAVVAFYVVLSVHLGWHYAVDAYASVLIIGALAWPLRLGPFRPA